VKFLRVNPVSPVDFLNRSLISDAIRQRKLPWLRRLSQIWRQGGNNKSAICLQLLRLSRGRLSYRLTSPPALEATS